MQTKKCTRCKETKLIIDFYKIKTGKFGVQSQCKKCLNTYHQEYRKKNPGIRKKYDEKYILNNKETIKNYQQKWYKSNKDKIKKYCINNADIIKNRKKQYRKANLENIKNKGREYYKDHSSEIIKNVKLWRKNNPGLRREQEHKRRALKNNVISEKINELQVYENHNWVCGICKKKINKNLKHPNPKSVSLDHFFPLSKGGNHIYSNVQPAHLICNIKKYNNIYNAQLKLI